MPTYSMIQAILLLITGPILIGIAIWLWLPKNLEGKEIPKEGVNDVKGGKEKDVVREGGSDEVKGSTEDWGMVLYTALHDIKNPIQSMIGVLENLEEKQYEDGYLPHQLVLLRNSINDITLTIENSVLLRESEGKQKGAARELVNMMQIVDDVVVEMTSRAEKEDAHIQIEPNNLDKAIPPVWGNKRAFKCMLQNLVSNSIKYRNKNDRTVIEISVIADIQNVSLAVKDNGQGMSPERVDKIGREPFKRKQSPLDSEGMGLGLYTVWHTVNRYGGDLKPKSRLGEGTTITLVFPIARPGGAIDSHLVEAQ